MVTAHEVFGDNEVLRKFLCEADVSIDTDT